MIGGAKGIGLGIDLGLVNQYNRTGSQSYIEPEVLDSLVGVWSAYGMTNDSPDRSTIKNKLSNKGGDFVISNAAFKLNSGFGKYEVDFTVYNNQNVLVSPNKIVSIAGREFISLLPYTELSKTISSYKIKVTGLIGELSYWYRNQDGSESRIIITKDGIYQLSTCYNVENGQGSSVGFNGYSESSCTIEQIPSFQGAFVTDGINDLIKSTKSATEMLDGSNEVTVVSMIHQIKTNSDVIRNNWFFTPVSYLENRVVENKTGKTGIYGYTSTNVTNAQISDITPILGDKNDYTLYSKIEDGDRDYFTVEGFQNQGIWYVSSIAWYWTIIANKVLTTDQINQVIAYFNLDKYVKPDIYYNVKKQGLTNDTPDEDWYLKDFSGNGRDMTLYNYARTPESGINEEGGLQSDGVDDYGQFVGDLGLKDYTVAADRSYQDENVNCVPFISSVRRMGGAPFLMEYVHPTLNVVYPYSYDGTTGTVLLNSSRQISYQSTYVYNRNSIARGNSVKTGDGLTIGSNEGASQYSKLCLWSFLLFPYSMSEFLIERQLKKHKLGTLYPDMVEFRPVIKQDNRIKSIKYYIDGKTANIGQYYPIGAGLGIAVETVQPYMVKSLKVNGVKTIPNADYKVFNARLDSKSPQKITMDIQVDSSLVQWNPVVESNVPYKSLRYYNNVQGTGWKQFEVGEYLPIGSTVLIRVNLNGSIDELSGATSSQLKNIQIGRNGVAEYDISGVLTSESPQKINITIDEYIRYEDIVQPYPILLGFRDENGNEVSWGGKLRVGSTATFTKDLKDSYLLKGMYNIESIWLNNENVILVVAGRELGIEKKMEFKSVKEYLIDNNEPKCILSPSRLRMPNSSYKILGYIPDISGHGNHGVIHNSAYVEGSGVNEDGSYQFDGVNDLVTIPTLSSGGKQVLMKVNQSNVDSCLYTQVSAGIGQDRMTTSLPTSLAYQGRWEITNWDKVYIDGIENNHISNEQLYDITHIITTISRSSIETVSPVIGALRVGNTLATFAQMSLYDFMLFDNISTDDKIKELNEYVGIEAKVELPPYYWDAYGKTNLDEDKATIQQRGVAVGDYDLTNNNFAYDKMSCYGGYDFENFNKWSNTQREDGIEVIERNAYSFTAKRIGTGQYFWDFKYNNIKTLNKELTVKAVSNKNVYVRWEFKYRTAEKPDTDTTMLLVKQVMTPNVPITVTLPYKTEEEQAELGVVEGSTYYLFYFDPSDIPVNEEYTVEMLPLYPNGLVYDGITDYSENANIPAFTDYTYIFKRDILGFNPRSVSMHKGTSTNAGRAFTSDYDYGETNEVLAYSFGSSIATPNATSKKIIYGTKTSVDGQPITPGSNIDDAGLFIGKWYDDFFKKMVFYKLILYPKTIPLLQINFLKNLMERDEIIDLNNKIFIQE